MDHAVDDRQESSDRTAHGGDAAPVADDHHDDGGPRADDHHDDRGPRHDDHHDDCALAAGDDHDDCAIEPDDRVIAAGHRDSRVADSGDAVRDRGSAASRDTDTTSGHFDDLAVLGSRIGGFTAGIAASLSRLQRRASEATGRTLRSARATPWNCASDAEGPTLRSRRP